MRSLQSMLLHLDNNLDVSVAMLECNPGALRKAR
jgi:hypothetical protein